MNIHKEALESVLTKKLAQLRCIAQGKANFNEADLSELLFIYYDLKKELKILEKIFE